MFLSYTDTKINENAPMRLLYFYVMQSNFFFLMECFVKHTLCSNETIHSALACGQQKNALSK